ncbi:hypothetical protein [Ornithinimicrobium kibberense]|uniref:hypothetical protein n=1 Tax=Ornithinimicrobium kibberense TaxID=282060 RepID=UPI00360A4E4E
MKSVIATHSASGGTHPRTDIHALLSRRVIPRPGRIRTTHCHRRIRYVTTARHVRAYVCCVIVGGMTPRSGRRPDDR